MASLSDYRAYISSILNAFDMQLPTDYPLNQSSEGRPGFPSLKIDQAINAAAADIIDKIASNVNNPYRSGLETQYTVVAVGGIGPNGAKLPSYSGPIGSVIIDGTNGTRTSVNDIFRINEDICFLKESGYYALDGTRFYYTGILANVDLVIIASPVDVTKVPDAYFDAVIADALKFLEVFEGKSVEAAQHWLAVSESYSQYIVAGVPLPNPAQSL